MSDPRTVLERAAVRVVPKADAFVRLERRRHRRVRNRRISAGVVAILVAIAGSYAAFTAFRGTSGTIPGATNEHHDLPNLATISCSGPGMPIVLTPAVRPQADGVHLEVTNETSLDLAIDIHPVDEPDLPANSTREIVWPLAPGEYGLLCVDPTRNETPTNPQDYAQIDVQDPEGLWVPPELGCTDTVEQYSDYTAESTGDLGSPVDIVRKRVSGLEASDLVEPAGYAETTTDSQVRIVRDGTVIALYHFLPDGHGGWLVDRSERCSDVQLGWSDQGSARSTAYPRGWFEWCPDVSATLPFGNQSEQEAADVALRFARAYLNGDAAVVADLEDPSVPANATWTIAGDAAALSVGASAQGDPGNLVRFGCGPDVAARTWVVTVDDGTNSASADFYLFLVLRSDGWKVWASY